jgi:mannose/fructose/N-acetylgalactosamine-specific phosphotransferase system component IIC
MIHAMELVKTAAQHEADRLAAAHHTKIVRRWTFLGIAIGAMAVAFIIHDGLGGVTIGVVVSRSFDALGDVFFDRGFDLD